MRPISAVLPALPGFPSPLSHLSWPIWRNSVAGPVRFAPMSRKEAARLWHKARRWDRKTRQPGRHGGIIGRTALAALYAPLFDFLNHRTGRLDPSLDAIAAKAGCCRRAVVDALARLRDLASSVAAPLRRDARRRGAVPVAAEDERLWAAASVAMDRLPRRRVSRARSGDARRA